LRSRDVTVFDTGKILRGSDGLADPSFLEDFMHLNAEGYAALNEELVRLLPAKAE
jgi:hypothetical protein